MWRLSFLAVIWTIWNERNSRCFEGIASNESNLVEKSKFLVARVVKGSVPIWVHGGPGTVTVKEKVEPDPEPEPFRNRFLSSGTRTRSIYGKSLDPGLGRE